MRNYLNKYEIETLALTAQLHGNLKSFDAKRGNESKYLNMTMTYFDKFLAELFNRVGDEAGHKIIRIFNDCDITYTARSMFSNGQEEKIMLGRSKIVELAESIIDGHCSKCNKTGDEAMKCSVQELFMFSEIPAVEESGDCPYRITINGPGADQKQLIVKYDDNYYRILSIDFLTKTLEIVYITNEEVIKVVKFLDVEGIGLSRKLLNAV